MLLNSVGQEEGGWYYCSIFMISQTDISSQTLTILSNIKKNHHITPYLHKNYGVTP